MRTSDKTRQSNSCVIVCCRVLHKVCAEQPATGHVAGVDEDPVDSLNSKRCTELVSLRGEKFCIECAKLTNQPANGSHEPHVDRDRLEVAREVRVEAKANLRAEHRRSKDLLVGEFINVEPNGVQLRRNEFGLKES